MNCAILSDSSFCLHHSSFSSDTPGWNRTNFLRDVSTALGHVSYRRVNSGIEWVSRRKELPAKRRERSGLAIDKHDLPGHLHPAGKLIENHSH